MAELTPRQIVQELDRYIVGQDAAYFCGSQENIAWSFFFKKIIYRLLVAKIRFGGYPRPFQASSALLTQMVSASM